MASKVMVGLRMRVVVIMGAKLCVTLQRMIFNSILYLSDIRLAMSPIAVHLCLAITPLIVPLLPPFNLTLTHPLTVFVCGCGCACGWVGVGVG